MRHFQYLFVMLLAASTTASKAQNNWDGDNPLGNFTWCSNWFADSCPTLGNWTTANDLNFNFRNNPAQVTLYFDLGGWRNVRNIIYANTFTAGLPLNTDGNGINFYGKIENYTPDFTQTLNLPLAGHNATVIELNPINGGMIFNQLIYNPGNVNFNVYGNNGKKITLNSYPQGNAATRLLIRQYSIVEVNYNNAASLSGGYVVESGELWVNSAGIIQGPIQVGNGTANFNKIYISHASVATTVANAITVPTNSPNATIGSLNTSGTHTYSGAINLNNNDVYFDPYNAGGTLHFTGVISGTGGIRKINAGLVRLSASNTYTGTTNIAAGTVQLGTSNVIANASNVLMNGGTLSTGATTGYSETVGLLSLSANSTIALGTGLHQLNFSASNAVGWTAGRTLTITGWNFNCNSGRIFVGNSATGLTAAQLAQITFQGYPAGAKITSAGELLPNNVTLTATGGTLLGAYPTLRTAFAAINSGTHTGAITINILDDITETMVAQLNNNAAVTSVLIQPAGCGARTVTGDFSGGPMIDFNGADNVTVNGLNTGGNSLTITNMSTSATSGTCTIRFQTDATNNLITNCTVLGSSSSATGTNGGNIWFGSNSTLTGNDNNTVSNCNIGPAGANLPSKGIYLTGTAIAGRENDNITIANNNIYDCFSSTVNSAGIDLGSGTFGVAITNNRIYQTAPRTVTASCTNIGIRIFNTSGTGYTISGNAMGYANAAGTGTLSVTGGATINFVYQGIYANTAAGTASTVQNNTVAGISLTETLTSPTQVFNGIFLVNGVYNVTANTIGLPTAPILLNSSNNISISSAPIALQPTNAGSNIVQDNVIQSISFTAGIAATMTFTGLYVSGPGNYEIKSNTIGNVVAANSISIGTLGVSTGGAIVRGIQTNATGNVTIGGLGVGNTIQNITVNNTATNALYGIQTGTGTATINISYNTVRGMSLASTATTSSQFYGISTNTFANGITISNNLLGDASLGLVSYGAAASHFWGIVINNGAAISGNVLIKGNSFMGINNPVASPTAQHHYINNNISAPSIEISDNTFTNLICNAANIAFLVNTTSTLSATGIKTVSNNRIIGTFSKPSAGGNVTLYYDGGVSFAGATANNTNNNFSNITASATTPISGWYNWETGNTTKTISNNTFENWIGGTTGVINSNYLGDNSVIANNIVRNISGGGNVTGITTGNSGSANLVTISDNTVNNLSGNTLTLGIYNITPATVLSTVIQNNTVDGVTSVTNTAVGINDNASGTTKTISGNTVRNVSSANIASGIACNSVNPNSGTISGNIIGPVSSTGNNNVSGISGGTSMAVIIASGNTISGLTGTNTGASAYVRGIDIQGTTALVASDNTISNLNGSAGATNNTVSGILYAGSATGNLVSGNTIFDLHANHPTAGTGSVGVNLSVNTAGGSVVQNRIYGLYNVSTSPLSIANGFFINGGTYTLANNMVSLINNDVTSVAGFSEASNIGARKYFYNSVYIGGTSTGSGTSSGIISLGNSELKNNILHNTRTSTGKNYAIIATNLPSSNNNILNSNDANTIVQIASADKSFLQWQAYSGGDNNSFSGIPIAFADTATADLHLSTTCSDAESNGVPVSINNDYDAQSRNATTPDIGADEFTGVPPADVTCPNVAICLGGSTTLNVASSDATYTYSWSPATGLSATTGAIVTASPIVTTTYLITATSPAGCVKTKFVTVTVNTLPAAIAVNPPLITACLNTTQMFTASPVSNSTLSVGNPNATSLAANTPYRQGVVTSQSRVQYLITKAELNALGLNTPAKIISLGFDVTAAGSGAMPNYTISIAPTAATSMTATYIATGFTTVYNTTGLSPTTGINTHTFTTPFNWDGLSNIVINICSNGSGGTASAVRATTFTSNPMTTSGIATGQCGIATGATNLTRPIIILGLENPITWSPITELYTDSAATIAYVSGTHSPIVYVHPSAPRVYTATATNPAGGCTVTATGTFSTAVSTWDGTAWSPSVPTGGTSLNFTGDFSSTANLSGCSCTVTNGNVAINGPHSMTLTEGLTVLSGPATSMTFYDTASLLQINDAAVNSGVIRMECITQPMYRYDFTYWGSPVTAASNYTLGMLSPFTLSDKYFSWIPTVSNSFGTWLHETTATVMIPGKGYIVRAPQSFSTNIGIKVPYTALFEGTPNNGIVTVPIYHGTVPSPNYNDDYNLLSNPFPSAVDAEKFLSEPSNVPVLDGTIYFWTHNSPVSAANPDPFYGDFIYNYSANDYASWNKLGGTGTTSAAASGGAVPNGFIAAGQGFFTRSAGAASGAVATFNNAMRVAGNNGQFFRNANTEVSDFERHRLWLNLVSNSGSFNQILVGYAEGATSGWDRSYDGIYFSEGNSIQFYSVIPEQKLVIQGRPLPFTDTDQVPLGFVTAAADTFSFRIDHFDALFENQAVYIEDRWLGIVHDLKQSPYIFTSEAGTFDTRFVLRYTDAALNNSDFTTPNSLIAFVDKQQLHIESAREIQSVGIFEVSGKRLTVFDSGNRKSITKDFVWANGVYLLKVLFSDGTVMTVKVLN